MYHLYPVRMYLYHVHVMYVVNNDEYKAVLFTFTAMQSTVLD